MELSPLGSLRELLDKSPKQPEAAQLSLPTGIARGMAHLHAMRPKPMLHHDLKSANVLVWPGTGSELVSKISDLGLATGTSGTTMKTQP